METFQLGRCQSTSGKALCVLSCSSDFKTLDKADPSTPSVVKFDTNNVEIKEYFVEQETYKTHDKEEQPRRIAKFF